MLYAIVILAVTAVGGLVLASHVLRNKQAPWALSIIHALLGATGLITLLVTGAQSGWPGTLVNSIILLVIAALGGFYLASKHLKNTIAPKPVVIIHAGVAVVGFLILVSLYLK